MGADRIAVIVCCGDRPVTPELLRGLSDALLAAHEAVMLDTHAGEGWRGRYDYWLYADWLMPAPTPTVAPAPAEYRPCPGCDGDGTLAGAPCPVCGGRAWRADWDFGVGHPVAWVREAVAAGRTEGRPNWVLGPDGRFRPWWWFDRALAEYPGCWVVPVRGGP
ncbi:hypothetical protein J0H58_11715 [bacterium]|nr:hypothetical protein [bacterium]